MQKCELPANHDPAPCHCSDLLCDPTVPEDRCEKSEEAKGLKRLFGASKMTRPTKDIPGSRRFSTISVDSIPIAKVTITSEDENEVLWNQDLVTAFDINKPEILARDP